MIKDKILGNQHDIEPAHAPSGLLLLVGGLGVGAVGDEGLLGWFAATRGPSLTTWSARTKLFGECLVLYKLDPSLPHKR